MLPPKEFTENNSPHPQMAGGLCLDKALLMTEAALGASSGELAPSQAIRVLGKHLAQPQLSLK